MNAVTSKQQANQKAKASILSVLKNAGTCPFEEGLALCNGEKYTLASNHRLGQALLTPQVHKDSKEPGEHHTIQRALPCWTGTMTAYVRPERTFKEETERIRSLGSGRFIVYTDPRTGTRWLFPVPRKYLDKKNTILVCEKKDYAIYIDNDDRIIWPKRVDAIEKFPAEDGTYRADLMHDIPNKGEADSNHNIRFLLRANARVGPVATDCGRAPFEERRRLLLNLSPMTPLGIVVEEF